MTVSLSRTLPIINKRGLHARASAKFAAVATEHSEVTVRVEREDQIVEGTSIMDLMMLAAGIGSDITVHIEGEAAKAQAALDALDALVSSRFGEEI